MKLRELGRKVIKYLGQVPPVDLYGGPGWAGLDYTDWAALSSPNGTDNEKSAEQAARYDEGMLDLEQ